MSGLVDLLRSYSNRSDLLVQLTKARKLAIEHDAWDERSDLTVSAHPVRTWRVRDRLTEDDVNRLIAEFLWGTSKGELAEQYAVSFSTVKNILRRHGVRRTYSG